MAPISAQYEGEEASESRSSRVRRPRRRSPTVTASPREAKPPSRKRRRSGSAKERSNRLKRKRAVKSRKEEEAAAASASAAKEQASSSEASSTISSPARLPCLPTIVFSPGTEVRIKVSQEVEDTYEKELSKYMDKINRDMSLPTLDETISSTYLRMDELLPVRESATKTILQAAKFVLGLSSHIDGKPLARSSGFFFDWDETTRRGTVVTSAHIISTKYTPDTRKYEPNSQVTVHINRKTSVPACLLYYDKHYNLAVFECGMNLRPQIPCLSDEVSCGQSVFFLGRNERLNLDTSYGKVEWFEDHHLKYVNCEVAECDSGGPVINFDGGIVGLTNPTTTTAFMPVPVLLRCLRLLKKFNCIPRLHLGLKLSPIKYLDPAQIELISDSYGITEGLIAEKVAVGSAAEKVGIRIGDIIESWNGKCISTTADLDGMLLGICEDHLNKGNVLGSSMELSVVVFRVRKEDRSMKKLVLIISDELEVFVEQGTYMVSAREGSCEVVSPAVDLSPGSKAPHGMGDRDSEN